MLGARDRRMRLSRWDRGRARLILLIDPDPVSRDISTLLMRYFGYEVQAAATYREGLYLARAIRPAAIVSELMVDGTGRKMAVEELTAHPATAGIPVLVLSSQDLPDDRERALSRPAPPVSWRSHVTGSICGACSPRPSGDSCDAG